MNRFQFPRMLVYSAVMLFLASCGAGDGQKSGADTTAAKSATTVIPEPPVTSTIITTPENIMVITHKVANYAKWKVAYDAHDSARLANKIHNYVVARGLEDSNMVMVALKVEDIDKAKAFAKDPGLKNAMQKAGVTGAPSFTFTTLTFQDTAAVNTPLRSRTMFTVKDWNAWQKAFEEGKQERLDNGLTVRVYGHDPDDNHKVVLVTALTDTAKAFAYWKSDLLKKRRAESGVVTVPQRFVFRIVQRY